MYKKFLSAIILVFTFLFFNLSSNSINIHAETAELPGEVYDNAGWGEKMNYWAMINYGADYIGSNEIIIDIQREAIANQDVKFIVITENEYASDTLTYYERNVDAGFSSRINYILKNPNYGQKYITVLLLRELAKDPTDNLIVDKIIIEVDQKRNISELTSLDILTIQEVSNDIESLVPYKVNVTLNEDTIEGTIDDYVLKSVTYRLASKVGSPTLNALYESTNNYWFTVYQNGVYEIVVEDIFGYTITKTIEITNIKDPAIIIEIDPSVTGPINREYTIDVNVIYFDSGVKLNSDELNKLDVTFNGNTYSIKENQQIIVSENGIYHIVAETLNGSTTEFIVEINNIDREFPFAEALSQITVYTENLDAFNPENEIFVYDNVSEVENIRVELTYYKVINNGGTPSQGSLFIGDFEDVKAYLYTVRDLYIVYKVTDEAGNSVERTSYVLSIDNTIPMISYTVEKIELYINDPRPSDEELERLYGLIVEDNSLYPGSDKEFTYYKDYKNLPVDENGKLNKLGDYYIYVSAVDEAGNKSASIALLVEVCVRLITIQADNQYVIYGDYTSDQIKVTYKCVTREGLKVDCREELLAGDTISGELYVMDAYYTGSYPIYYDNIRIPSDLYSLKFNKIDEEGNEIRFVIKPRTIKVIADNKEKDYLDDDPELTYSIDMNVCDSNHEDYNPDYRCTFVNGDSFMGQIERYMGSPPAGVDIWYDEASWSVSEAVWFNVEGLVMTRPITQGTLDVLELFNGGKDNYAIDFVDAEFKINPKVVLAYIERASKIYGEKDPVYTLSECRGKYPIDGATIEFCMNEIGITLTRTVTGEIVRADASGNYLDYYVISGVRANMNYVVEFFNSYLTIERRNISISVVGDLDQDSNPTGKYTIYYEDDIPFVEVYDSSTLPTEGLAYDLDLTVPVADKFFYGKADIYTSDNQLVTDYVSGIGLYTIKKGSIMIVDMNDQNAESNYNITFNNGILEVIKKQIWIKIIRDLSKIYGDNDMLFTVSDLDGYDEYTILEANGRYIIEITPTTLDDGEPYIPRDNERMKYHLNRNEGIYVGLYDIFIEKLIGCENYEVNLFEKYKYEIVRRDMNIEIYDQTVIYRDIPRPFTYNEELARASLQYDDRLDGSPIAEEYVHVGEYSIGIGTIKVLDLENKDVSFNYKFIIDEGTLTVVQREITIVSRAGQSKQYGDFDPDEFLFDVYHNGVLEELPSEQYEGKLGREEGEVPGKTYAINAGNLKIHNFGDEINVIENYLIVGWDFANRFEIVKRSITIKAKDVEAMYGNDYSKDIVYETGGKLAYNLTLKIDGYPIYDILSGELKIIGTVDGVGEYVISSADIRILRKETNEDVTNKYYDFTHEDATLTIYARTIKINPHDGQSKLYGESDVGITFSYTPDLLMQTDKFVGELQRTPRIVNGKEVTEDIGEYVIGLGTLRVQTESGKDNYELVMDGTKTFVIKPRTLTVKANDLEIYYGDEFELTYTISGDGLVNNPNLGIVDKIRGELNLDREYTGYGTYRILGENLNIDNIHNYTYTFTPGILIVNKRVITITPSENTLYKIYGEEDPEVFKFTIDFNAAYSGALTRELGEDVGKYKILMGDLSFGPNYDVILKEAYFTILARTIDVRAIDTGKIYGFEEPKLTYTYVGTLVGNDKFTGSLTREAGEEVGDYQILQGSLSLTKNYKIVYTPGVFSIRYAEFTGITIYSLTNNSYQVKGEEEEVQLYARFNPGADETHIGDVEWKVVKVLGNGEESPWEFTKDPINNIVSFFPSGSVGTYIISASYGGKVGYHEVLVELSTIGNVYIRHVNGEVNQILGRESELTYEVIVPETANNEATIQWLINGVVVQTYKVGTGNRYFYYTPALGKGEYTVQSKIANKTSDPLYFYVNNNNPPVITLIGEPVIYIEAKTGTDYIEQGATVIDDIDGDITETKLVISGYVNEDVKGTYYIKYDAIDSHGNNAISVYRQVVVRDTTAPIVTLNGNKEIILLYGQEYIEYGASAVDNYDGPVEVMINNPIIIDKIGTYEVTYFAYDDSGNRGTAVRYVEIIDNISPLITLIGDEITYVEVYTEFKDPGARVHDNVDGDFIIEASSFYYGDTRIPSLDTSKLGTYYVRYDYTDTSGNVGTGVVRTVIVRDTTPPEIILNGTNPYIIRYSYPTINYTEPGAIAKDNYDKEVPVTISGQLGSELGTYYLYYDAVDSNGNIAATVTRQVVIVDIANPIIHFMNTDVCPQYITIEALYEKYNTNCNAPGFGVWVEDDYMEDLDELQKRIVVRGEVDDTTVGLYIISYDVTDMAGNAAVTLNRYVRVVDTTAPKLTLIGGAEDGSQVVEVFEEYVELGVEAYDRYDEYHNIEVDVRITQNVNVNKLGEYIVTYNATDSNGNRAIPIIRKVYVKDTKPPVITLIGDNPITIERGLDYIEYGATAIDNYDGPMSNITIINAPSGMRLGKYEVTYRAIDTSGNIGEAIRIVNVVDTIPPIVLGVEDGMYYKNPVSIYFIPTLGTDEVLRGWLNNVEITSPWYVEAEGEYNLVVQDDAGNETRIWFAIDTTPPQILGVKNNEYTNRETVLVYSNEKIKYYEYRYQSGDWLRVEDQTISFTNEGKYWLYAVDMADNVSNVISFVIDRTAPHYSLIGVLNKGITNTEVNLTVEEGASVVVNALYNIPTLYTFTEDGYYQVTIRDAASNTINLQFVINRTLNVKVNNKPITIITQHNAINKISITGTYPRNSGYMLVKPLVNGGFEYVSGKLFSESEYQKLISGGTVEFGVAGTDDTYMFVAFVVDAEELNKFGTQTVDDDEDGDGSLIYIALAIVLALLIGFFFLIFLKRRKKEEDEEEEETIIDDY